MIFNSKPLIIGLESPKIIIIEGFLKAQTSFLKFLQAHGSVLEISKVFYKITIQELIKEAGETNSTTQ
jgi:hypothetical protein